MSRVTSPSVYKLSDYTFLNRKIREDNLYTVYKHPPPFHDNLNIYLKIVVFIQDILSSSTGKQIYLVQIILEIR